MLRDDSRRPDVLLYPRLWRPYCVELGSERNPLVYIHHPAGQAAGKSLLQYGAADTLVTIFTDGSLGLHSWLHYDRTLTNHFYFEKDPSWSRAAGKRRLPGPWPRNSVLKIRVFAV